ncbi:MAG: beta-ketoacyl-ACP synthase II [Acidimicrobiales bacterium]
MPRSRRRVVVTAIGAVSPLGLTVDATWDAMVAGRSGVGPIQGFDASRLAVSIAAEVGGFDAGAIFGRRRARHLDRVVQFALVASGEAIEASKLDPVDAPDRVGVVYGTGIGGVRSLADGIGVLSTRGPEWVGPYVLPMMIPNMAAGEIAMEWGLKGPNLATVTACAASAHAIAAGADLIALDRADAMVCGGAEAAVIEIGIAGFAAMKALSTRNEDPQGASRPFDAGRDGFVMGEGAATVVLEDRELALARGAPILAELLGYGSTCDAYHITAPRPGGDGAIRAMRDALGDAGAAPSEVGYINAHGTSTVPNDRVETFAIKEVFGSVPPPVSSTKSMTGHTLGAAGALESVVCIQALRTGILPPTINQERADPDCDLDVVANHARRTSIEVALTNSFGFGGHNVTLAWGRA